jgi:hypothetical protein
MANVLVMSMVLITLITYQDTRGTGEVLVVVVVFSFR